VSYRSISGLFEHLLIAVRDLPRIGSYWASGQVGTFISFLLGDFSQDLRRGFFFPARSSRGVFRPHAAAPTIAFSPPSRRRGRRAGADRGPLLISVGMQTQWPPLKPPPSAWTGYMSLMKVTLWPMKTSSSIVTALAELQLGAIFCSGPARSSSRPLRPAPGWRRGSGRSRPSRRRFSATREDASRIWMTRNPPARSTRASSALDAVEEVLRPPP